MSNELSLETQLRSSYLAQSAPKRVEQSRIGCIVALVFMPLGACLDVVIYPELITELTFIRMVAVALVAMTYPLHLANFAPRWVKQINLSYPVILTLALCLMINITEGLNGPYYAGLIMLILGVSLLLPLTLAEAIVFVGFTVAAYIVFGSIGSNEQIEARLAFNNLYFLISTGVIAVTASYFAEKARFREFQLTYELDQRNKQLADLDRMKSDFYANISHELRTPLTLILAPVEDLLASIDLDKKVGRQLRYVRENTYRLLKLVNDLLDVLKLEEKKDLLEQQPVALQGILSSIISSMEPLAARKVIRLSFQNTGNKSANVLGDASAIEKIFINLINNALKFTESGGSVTVTMTSTDDVVQVEVADTGVGIAEDQISHIFDRFHQVDSSATRKHQGTGLGLALVKELTELQGGEVIVASTPSVGTTMTVTLPRLSEDEANQLTGDQPIAYGSDDEVDGLDTLHKTANLSIAESQSAEFVPKQESDPSPIEYTGASLLIVEDEPDVRNYLAEALAHTYEIDVAYDGEEGLRKIRADKPDLVVLDLMLPKMDGLSVCEAAKNDPETRQTKIMLLTARTDEQSKMTALEHGADDFLTKPFSTVEIKTRLHNLWENSGLERNLKNKNDDLSAAIQELKATQGHLVQSEKLNAIGRLAAGLLHEVNNPLNFAFGTFQLLEREPALTGDDNIKEMLADIRVGMERISHIVKDLKAFAYPEKSDLEKVFVLNSVLETAIRLTSKKTQSTKLHVDIHETVELNGSQSHIIQVLVNLIENAVDAMTEAGVKDQEINIFLTEHETNANRVCVHVKDNGPGISEEKMQLVFDPFFTTKDVGAGMGMGLSVASTIIKNHGGLLRVMSEEGSYTDFYFDLQRDRAHASA